VGFDVLAGAFASLVGGFVACAEGFVGFAVLAGGLATGGFFAAGEAAAGFGGALSFVASGIALTSPQFGHFTFFPASEASTRIAFEHALQFNLGMSSFFRFRFAQSLDEFFGEFL
jgi:hypothetical protein